MTRIILHLGPGKCGSSAIRRHVRAETRRPDALFDSVFLTPGDIRGLRQTPVAPGVAARLGGLFRRTTAQGRLLIISHEVLFKLADVRRAVIHLAQAETDSITALAYVRRTSDFQRSSYMQWLFRLPERIAETAAVLRAEGIDPAMFSGVERHLIAVALGHAQIGRPRGGPSYFNWSESLPQLRKSLQKQGVDLQVGALPPRHAAVPLIADFRARIGLPPQRGADTGEVVNPAFAPDVVEAVSAAIEAGHLMPGPHEANEFLALDHTGLTGLIPPDPDFNSVLSAAIDTAYAARNRRVAVQFGIDPAYFEPDLCVDRDQVIARISQERERRSGAALAIRRAGRAQAADAIAKAWSTYATP